MSKPEDILLAALREFDETEQDEAFGALRALIAELAEARHHATLQTALLETSRIRVASLIAERDEARVFMHKSNNHIASLEARLNEAREAMQEADELLAGMWSYSEESRANLSHVWYVKASDRLRTALASISDEGGTRVRVENRREMPVLPMRPADTEGGDK